MPDCLCKKSVNGYFQLKCVMGKCEECKIKPYVYQLDRENISFYQFERVPTGKIGKDGKTTKRTERIAHTDIAVEVKKKLVAKANYYLLHRYEVANDKFH